MKQLEQKDKETYCWECPRCGTTHAENVFVCNQWNREGECVYNCNDRPLYEKILTTQKEISCAE